MATKLNGVDDWVRTPPPQGSFCNRLGNVIYNPEENSFLGRTPKRWGIMLTFYLVFYAVLALLFALCMGGLFLSLETNRPSYMLEHSLIGANPGVTSRPLSESTVLRIHVENSSDYQQYVDQLDDFFAGYSGERWWMSHKNCTAEDNYGFPDNPCYFIKVNRIIGWKPDCYNASDLPADMPQDLTEYIHSRSSLEQKQIWISCQEEKSNDTKIEYPWGRGLPSVFYPFLNEEGYRSPLVAIRITPPVNSLVIIRCRAWAKNIIYNKSLKEPSGYTRLQLYIESNTAGETTESLT